MSICILTCKDESDAKREVVWMAAKERHIDMHVLVKESTYPSIYQGVKVVRPCTRRDRRGWKRHISIIQQALQWSELYNRLFDNQHHTTSSLTIGIVQQALWQSASYNKLSDNRHRTTGSLTIAIVQQPVRQSELWFWHYVFSQQVFHWLPCGFKPTSWHRHRHGLVIYTTLENAHIWIFLASITLYPKVSFDRDFLW